MKSGVKRRCVAWNLSAFCSRGDEGGVIFPVFQAILAGDFILSAASMALARIGDITVVKVLSQVIEDLVRGRVIPALRGLGEAGTWASIVSVVLSGEFMQLGSKENENERFKHYLEKTFKKTASLIANSCKAVCTFLLRTDEPTGGEPARPCVLTSSLLQGLHPGEL